MRLKSCMFLLLHLQVHLACRCPLGSLATLDNPDTKKKGENMSLFIDIAYKIIFKK